jgi:hypothetical protein
MDRFMNGLNYYISHIVELHYYVELEEMVHTVVKVEKQFKQKGTFDKANHHALKNLENPIERITLRVVHHKRMRSEKSNTLERIKTSWSLLKVTMLLLLLAIVRLNIYVV